MRMPTLRLFVVFALLLAPRIVADRDGDAGAGRPIVVHAQPMPRGGGAGDDAMGGNAVAADRVGRLRYRAILHLTSESEDFGGFSGLSIGGRHLTAVSDQGHWLTASLALDARGTITGLRAARMGRLCDDDGAPVAWERRDAEEIQHLPGHGYLVSFERHHRIVLYAESENGATHPQPARGATAFDRVPKPFPFPPGIVTTQRNKGMEAVALLPDGRLLTFAEDLRTIDDDIIGWIGRPEAGDWRHLTLPGLGDFLPTGAAVLPAGDLLLLVRNYSRETGNLIRLLMLEAASLTPGSRLRPVELARIEPPATIDNMESVAIGTGPAGETLIYLLSDNNYNDQQRTLLMQFELLDE